MNYNTWLVKNGFMTLNGQDASARTSRTLFAQGKFWSNVDWSKTRAYAMGLGRDLHQRQGARGKGIVNPGAEYEPSRRRSSSGSRPTSIPETGEHAVGARLHARGGLQRRYDPGLIPDLILTNSDGYRVAWQTSLGGIGKTVIETNRDVWSGDHCSVDPELVKGILFSNFKLNAPNAYMGDVMPTILDLFKVKPTTNLDGKSLLVK